MGMLPALDPGCKGRCAIGLDRWLPLGLNVPGIKIRFEGCHPALSSRGVQIRVLAAYPRRIAATKAEVVDLALEIRVRIVAIVPLGIGSAHIYSVTNPDMAGN